MSTTAAVIMGFIAKFAILRKIKKAVETARGMTK